GPPARKQEHGPAAIGPGDRRIKHIGPHHHPRPAAKQRIVDRAVFIACEIADVHRFEPPDPGLQRLAGERIGKRARQHFREDREDRRAPTHTGSSSATGSSSPGGGSITRRPAARSTTGTTARVNGAISGGPAGRAISSVSPAPKSCTARTSPSSVPSASAAARPIRSARLYPSS